MLNRMMDDFNAVHRLKGIEFEVENSSKTYKLISDEVAELEEEVIKGSLDTLNKKDTAKELADILYITAQRMRLMGLDVDGLLKAVHNSNMTKVITNGNRDKELQTARLRYPKAYLNEGQCTSVLIDEDTGKVIKPTTYLPAWIKEEFLN